MNNLCGYAGILGEEFTNDVPNDEENEDKEWKYNNGYPILKWQLEVK